MAVRALPATYWPAARNILWLVTAIVLPVAWWLIVSDPSNGGDARSYYEAWIGGLYDRPWHSPHAFVYTPPVGILLAPFTLLPWPVFYGLLLLASMGALVYLVGPWAGLALIVFYPALHDLTDGNIHLLIAAAITLGPAWWSVALLTKVTPGISLAYYVAARQWRYAVHAAGIAAVIALVTVAIGPWGIDLWADWTGILEEGLGGTAHPWAMIDWPLTVRLPIALGLALIGGWRRWPWLLPVSVLFALPAVWVSSGAVLLAIPRFVRQPRPESRPECGRRSPR